MHCPYFQFDICRSCSLLDQSAEQLLVQKRAQLQQLFPQVAVSSVASLSAEGSRIRARLAVFGSPEQPQFGFLDRQRKVAAADQCPLHHAEINRFLPLLAGCISRYQLTPYDMVSDRGELKFAIITCSPAARSDHGPSAAASPARLMLQLVLRSREAVDRVHRMWNDCRNDELAAVEVCSVNLQPVRSSLLNGTTEIPVSVSQRLAVRYRAGASPAFTERTVLYGPQCFIQTNHGIAELLYQQAACIVQRESVLSLLDIYCGAGAFSLLAAVPGVHIRGFDLAADAIACANEGARLAAIDSASYVCFDARLPPADNSESFDVVVCNPPRRGLDAGSRQLLLTGDFKRVLYSSCSPETLQRDVQMLAPVYQLQELYPFDMFPFTSHVEALAVLSRS